MDENNTAGPGLRNWLTLGFLSIFWGASYILIKKALTIYSPYQVAALRLTISTLAFAPLLWLWRNRVDWRQSGWLLLVGLCGTGLPTLLFPLAQRHISSSVAGALNSLTPLFTLLIGVLFFHAAFQWRKFGGILLGLAGAVLLLLSGADGKAGNPWYGLPAVLAALCYATSTNIVGYKITKMGSGVISAASFVMVGLPAISLLGVAGVPQAVTTHPHAMAGLGYIAVLALVATVLASVLFFRLIQDAGPVFGSTVSYLVPVVAMFWGALDGESMGIWQLAGTVMVLSGVYLVRRRKGR